MKKFIKENWREIMGWATIGAFIYIILFRMDILPFSYGLDVGYFRLSFLAIATILILGWLKLNSKKY